MSKAGTQVFLVCSLFCPTKKFLHDKLFTTAQSDWIRLKICHQTAVSAALGPTREGRFLLPGSNRKPADVLIPHWTSGKDTAYDVTVINSLQTLTLFGKATTPGHALKVAYERKIKAAAKDCHRQGIVFIRLAAETLGGWHDVAVREIIFGRSCQSASWRGMLHS